MVKVGYWLAAEEYDPRTLVRNAALAEQEGFREAMVPDHFHPWLDDQGHSPFVWSVLGAIAEATSEMRLGTGVTCPTIRIHPALVAQAAATSACMFDDRGFVLGLGTGENLNEHVVGEGWPPNDVRREMLEEAVAVIRLLWEGGSQSHRGDYYTVENARIYDLPDDPPQIIIAAGGEESAELAAAIGDGLISTAPDREVVAAFGAAGGESKPKLAKLTVCWAESEGEARKTAYRLWRSSALKGELSTELALPAYFEQASEHVSEDEVAERIVCGPDPEKHLEGIRKFADAGFDLVYLHQVGPDQQGFFHFYRRELEPNLDSVQLAASRP